MEIHFLNPRNTSKKLPAIKILPVHVQAGDSRGSCLTIFCRYILYGYLVE